VLALPRLWRRSILRFHRDRSEEGFCIMKISVRPSASIALAAAALILSGAVAIPASAAAGDKGHCVGANACKGQSACQTASNDCSGLNACKGQGYLEMTKAECDKIEGAKFEPAG